MPDFIDAAQDISEAALEKNIKKARTKPSVPFSGFCLSCEEPLHTHRRYCDSDCREDHERRMKKGR